IREIAIETHPGRKKAAGETPDGRCGGLPAVPERPPSLEPVDGGGILQGDRILSASGGEGSRLRARTCWSSGCVCAAGLEQLSANEGRVSERQVGVDGGNAAGR